MSLNEYLKHFQKDHKLEIRCKFCFKNYKNFKFLESHLRKGVKTGGCRTLNSNRNKVQVHVLLQQVLIILKEFIE